MECTTTFGSGDPRLPVQTGTAPDAEKNMDLDTNNWRVLCQQIVLQPNATRRARIAARLHKILAEEQLRTVSPEEAGVLKVVNTLVNFMQQGHWRKQKTSRSATRRRSRSELRRAGGK